MLCGSIGLIGVVQSLKDSFGQPDLEVQEDNVLGESERTAIIRTRELCAINELAPQTGTDDVTCSTPHANRIKSFMVEPIKRLDGRERIPRPGLPCSFE